MYRRQLISTLSVISLCLVLLGTGFFSLYYQYQLAELKKNIERNVAIITEAVTDIIKDESDLYSDSFLSYLDTMANLSSTTILLCHVDGSIVSIVGDQEAVKLPEEAPAQVPGWAVEGPLTRQTYFGLTTFSSLFTHSSYVTGVSIVKTVSLLTPNGVGDSRIPVCLIYIASDASYVQAFLLDALNMFLLTAAAVLIISMIISSLTTQHMVQPLRAMSAAVYRFAHGDLDTRVTDYTDRDDEIGDLATAFNTMADSLAQSEKRRSEFVANVSHELKTPMTTISGFAEGILDGTIPPSRERESLEVISSETRRLSRLVRRMLELSRLQSQERVSAQVQFDVGEILLRVLVSLESKVSEKELEVVTHMPEEGVMVWGDPDAITQVCYNLLDNAIKFSKEKGVLTIGITLKGGKAYISIKNQGATIPPDQLSNIFERFHKADSSRSEREGVGLGLYIVKTILQTYKESIIVTSQNGETEFTFTLSEV